MKQRKWAMLVCSGFLFVGSTGCAANEYVPDHVASIEIVDEAPGYMVPLVVELLDQIPEDMRLEVNFDPEERFKAENCSTELYAASRYSSIFRQGSIEALPGFDIKRAVVDGAKSFAEKQGWEVVIEEHGTRRNSASLVSPEGYFFTVSSQERENGNGWYRVTANSPCFLTPTEGGFVHREH